MATKLEEALHALTRALQGRPFVLVFEQSHRDAQVSTLSTVCPPKQPNWMSRGLLDEARDELGRQWQQRASSHLKRHSRWSRSNERLFDTLSLAIDFKRSSESPKATLLRIESWTDEQAQQAEDWAIAEHLGASDTPVDRLPRPDFFPDEWVS